MVNLNVIASSFKLTQGFLLLRSFWRKDLLPKYQCLNSQSRWVYDNLVITTGKSTVITGSSQTTPVVTNRRKLKNVAQSCSDGIFFHLSAKVKHCKHNLGSWNTSKRFIWQKSLCNNTIWSWFVSFHFLSHKCIMLFCSWQKMIWGILYY